MHPTSIQISCRTFVTVTGRARTATIGGVDDRRGWNVGTWVDGSRGDVRRCGPARAAFRAHRSTKPPPQSLADRLDHGRLDLWQDGVAPHRALPTQPVRGGLTATPV